VNDSPAPCRNQRFFGRQGARWGDRFATFNMSRKGLAQLSPRSQCSLPANMNMRAELEAGAVVMNSISGPNGLTLRIGNDVLFRRPKSISLWSIDRAADGSYLVTCSMEHWILICRDGGPVSPGWSSRSIAAEWRIVPVVRQDHDAY